MKTLETAIESIRQSIYDAVGIPTANTSVSVDVRASGSIQIRIHGLAGHAAASETFRRLGITRREKSICSGGEFSTQMGKIGAHIVTAFYQGTPPCCEVVKTSERVPKYRMVETGEFEDLASTKVICAQTETAPSVN